MPSPTDSDRRRRSLSRMQDLLDTAEGRADVFAAVTALFPFCVGVVRPQPLPDGVAGPPEPDRYVMINPLTQRMVLLPAGVASMLVEEQNQEEGGGGGHESGFFDPFSALMREVMMMSAMEDRPGPPPASKASIEALKTVDEGLLARDGCDPHQECAVCLEELTVGTDAIEVDGAVKPHHEGNPTDVVVKEMPCGHRYHGGCIEQWLRMHGSCPICRYRMPEEEKESPKKSSAAAGLPQAPRGGVWVSTSTFGFPSFADAGMGRGMG